MGVLLGPPFSPEGGERREGALFDIALARNLPRAVLTDATGFVVLALGDPTNPVQVGDRQTFGFGDMAPTAVALSPDGSRLAVLSTFNDRVRFYAITDTGPVYESWSVNVGPTGNPRSR